VDKGNELLENSALKGSSLEEIVKASHNSNAPLFNNAGQHFNHLHFWKWMKPGGGGDKLPGELLKQLEVDIGPLDKVKKDFVDAGIGQFGSGWVWLAAKDGVVSVMKTPNGESPLLGGAVPILGCDVWEHSYYIDYRNRRDDYILDHLANWEYVAELLAAARAGQCAA
jgi:Fe-Mn family superoxide dismutase